MIECRSRVSGRGFVISAYSFRLTHETSARRAERNASEDKLLAEQRAEEESQEEPPPKEPPPGVAKCGPYYALCE